MKNDRFIFSNPKHDDQFPILNAKGNKEATIPWIFLEPKEPQAWYNHGKSLEELAKKGGLSWCEVLAILEDRPWREMNTEEAKRKVLQITSKHCCKCGNEMKWGVFAYNQDICWDCFRQHYLDIRSKYKIEGEDRELLDYMMAVTCGRYGYEW